MEIDLSGRIGISIKQRRRFSEERVTALSACALAAEHVKTAGFVLVWTSMQSEACYYSYPGRHGTLRIATHAKASRNPFMRNGPTVVSVTFPEHNASNDGRLNLLPEHIERHVANAIGLYLIRATKPE